MERPVKIFYGRPAKGAICRNTQAKLAQFIREVARHAPTKQLAAEVIRAAVAADAEECVDAKDRAFSTFSCMPTDDVRVLLQFQEELIYKCAKWNP